MDKKSSYTTFSVHVERYSDIDVAIFTPNRTFMVLFGAAHQANLTWYVSYPSSVGDAQSSQNSHGQSNLAPDMPPKRNKKTRFHINQIQPSDHDIVASEWLAIGQDIKGQYTQLLIG